MLSEIIWKIKYVKHKITWQLDCSSGLSLPGQTIKTPSLPFPFCLFKWIFNSPLFCSTVSTEGIKNVAQPKAW